MIYELEYTERKTHTHTHQNRGRWHILASLQIGTHVLTANELEMEAGIFKGCKKGDRLAVIRQVGPRDKTLWMVLRRDCHQCCRHGSSLSSLALPLVSVCDAVVVRPLLHLIFLIFPAHHRCRFNHPESLVLHLHRQHRQRHYLLLFLFLLSWVLSAFLLLCYLTKNREYFMWGTGLSRWRSTSYIFRKFKGIGG